MPPGAGTRVGHYEILAFLGAGGMGRVYKATDLKLQRTVALKFLPPQLADRGEKERFLQEARAASALDHPNIGTVHGIEETEAGDFYIVMSYYDGEVLSEKIKRGPMQSSQAVDIAMQIAHGLAEAHAKGIVHRDIKASNIMVTRQGAVKLLDFGLAKIAGGDALTQTGTTVGTASYMSPEQAEGRSVDLRSDIWSLGIVLYEMIAGRLPFHATSVPALLLAITTQAPGELEHVEPELEFIIQRCLAKDVAARYQSARELLDDLSHLHISSDTPTRTIEVDTDEMMRVRAASSGRRSTAAAAKDGRSWRRPALSAALLLVIAAAWWLFKLREEPQNAGEKRVVVLPFSNVGNDPANAATCDGLLETLTSRLTNLEQVGTPLWVVPASEVRRRKIIDASQAQSALHANLVVTGSVQRDASGVRLTVNLIDAGTLRQLGSAVLDDRAGNFSSLQDDAIANLAKLMAVELNPRALGKASGESTAAPLAYESYLKGLSYLQRYDKPGNIDAAIQLFASAVEADPSFALAYTRLAEAQWTKSRLDSSSKLLEEALANCERAQRINGQLAPVHVTLGRIYVGTGKYDLAVQEFQRALGLDPRSADAYQQLSRAYESLGRPADAEASIKKSIALRPDNWDGYNSLGGFYLRASRYREAADAFRRVLELTPDNAAAYSNLAVALSRMEDLAGAKRMYEKAIELNPTWAVYANLANLYYRDGEYQKALGNYEKALQLNDKDYRPWSGLAASYVALGQADKFRVPAERALKIVEAEAQRDPNNAEFQDQVAYLSALMGDRQRAMGHIESALALAPENRDVLYRAALVYHALGEKATALKYLSQALSHGYAKDRARRDPDWWDLRQDPSFQALMR
ncbi:MAG TPA: protein kinase [Bryobacteraceae bacterium]|nr:protein kinase [Bryobacteraceae bacterium]